MAVLQSESREKSIRFPVRGARVRRRTHVSRIDPARVFGARTFLLIIIIIISPAHFASAEITASYFKRPVGRSPDALGPVRNTHPPRCIGASFRRSRMLVLCKLEHVFNSPAIMAAARRQCTCTLQAAAAEDKSNFFGPCRFYRHRRPADGFRNRAVVKILFDNNSTYSKIKNP